MIYVEHLVASLLHLVSVIVHGASAGGWALTSVVLSANVALVAIVVRYPLDPPLSQAELDQRQKQAELSVKLALPDEGDEIGKEPMMPSPERTVSLDNWLVFAWVGPMMSLAAKRKLQYPDVSNPPSDCWECGTDVESVHCLA